MGVQTFAVLNGEEVVNLILWDDADADYQPEEGLTIVPTELGVDIGWTRRAGEWIAPIQEEPDPTPTEDPALLSAKLEALRQLTSLGITEPVARTIVGLPPA